MRGLIIAMALLGSVRVAAAQSSEVQRLLDAGDDAFARGDYTRAASSYDRAIAAEPHSVGATYFAKRADVFLLRKDYEAGLRWLAKTAEAAKPRNPLILEKKALLLDAMGRDDEADALAIRLLAKNPDAYALHLLLGEHRFAKKAAGAKDAIASYRAFLAKRPEALRDGDAMLRVKLGYAHLYLGTTAGFAAARVELAAAIDGAGKKKEIRRAARMGLCAALAGVGEWKQAAKTCAQALKGSGRKDPSLHYNLAMAQLRLGRIAEARRHAASYAEQRVDATRAHLLRGDVEVEAGELDAAEAWFQRAAAKAPDDPAVAYRLGRLYLRRDPPRLEEAATALATAHRAYPDRIEVVIDLAGALQRLGRWQEAVDLAVAGAGRAGTSASAQARLHLIAGDARYDEGRDLADALGHYDAALAADRGLADARAGAVLALNRIALAADAAAAREALERAVELDPASAMTRLNLGVLLLEAGDPAGALRHLEVAGKGAGDDFRVAWALARGYARTDATAPAEQHWRKAHGAAVAAGDREAAGMIATELAAVLIATHRADDAITLLDGVDEGDSEARRLRAVARLHRGIDRLQRGQTSNARGDLEKAASSGLLEGDDTLAATFAVAVAKLRLGEVKEGRQIAGARATWLVAPYDQYGIDYYLAYSYYREDSSKARKKALKLLEHLAGRVPGALRVRVKTLLRATYQKIAFEQYQRGRTREALRTLEKAKAVKLPGDDKILEHNIVVVEAGGDVEDAQRALERLGDDPPEALVNRGILLANQHRGREALGLWRQARERGARVPKLDAWIEALERVVGADRGGDR